MHLNKWKSNQINSSTEQEKYTSGGGWVSTQKSDSEREILARKW